MAWTKKDSETKNLTEEEKAYQQIEKHGFMYMESPLTDKKICVLMKDGVAPPPGAEIVYTADEVKYLFDLQPEDIKVLLKLNKFGKIIGREDPYGSKFGGELAECAFEEDGAEHTDREDRPSGVGVVPPPRKRKRDGDAPSDQHTLFQL
jgi:hypothetical protein